MIYDRADGGFPGSVNVLQGWLVAYCVFIALWSSLFMLDWKRRQYQLKHRWGLDTIEEFQKPRREFAEQLHSRMPAPAELEGSGGQFHSDGCHHLLYGLKHCDHPVEKVTNMGKIEVLYSNDALHYARQIVTAIFIGVGSFIVVFTTLGCMLMRARGQNVIAGSASAWTTLEYMDYDRFNALGDVNDVSACRNPRNVITRDLSDRSPGVRRSRSSFGQCLTAAVARSLTVRNVQALMISKLETG